MKPIPFLDLRAQVAELRTELDAATARVLEAGWFILGPEVEAFEAAYARATGAAHCIGVGNGLDALTLSLRALDIGPGDEVIVPAHTFVATWLAVSACGATIVAVDVDDATLNLCPAGTAAAITPRTRAVIPVHLYGAPCDIPAFERLGEKHGIAILYDAAQAHGATTADDAPVGHQGAACTWSFYPGKNLGALGDGGAITTNDDALAARLRMLRNYGCRTKYVHELEGTNSRLDSMQAAYLNAKLPHLAPWNQRRRVLAEAYDAAFQGTVAFSEIRRVETDVARSSHHLYVVRTPNRDGALARLKERQIGALIHYPTACHQHAAYAHLGFEAGRFPNAERAAAEVLSLPISPHHPVDDTVSRVMEALEEPPGDKRSGLPG